MKTAHYTFTTWNDSVMAAGFDSGLDASRQSALVRRPAGTVRAQAEDKIVDLTEWRAANLEEPDSQGEDLDWESAGPDWEEEPPPPRPRKSHRAMVAAELVSTLCVVAVAAVLILRILTF